MPRISRAEEKIRLEKIRVMLAEGRNKDDISTTLGIHPRTLRRYKRLIREGIIGDLDGKKVVDLWVAHKKRMEQIIAECYRKLDKGADSDVSPDKLYRTIQSCSESITDMGIKVGIVPPVAQKLNVDMEVKKEDEDLAKLLATHRKDIGSEDTDTEPESPTEGA